MKTVQATNESMYKTTTMIKAIISTVIFLLAQNIMVAQVKLPAYPDSLFPTYYHQRYTLFQSLPQTKGDVIFLGNSITDGGEWSELFADNRVKNRGISGDITAGVIYRINEIAERKPAKVFLMIGTNDLARNITPDSVVKNILLSVAWLRQQSPGTKIYVQSILPVNNVYGKFTGHTANSELIEKVNENLKEKASLNQYTYIDLHTPFSDANGKLNAALTNDGLHLKGEGYLLWKHIVYPYVYDLQARPSIIPLPQTLQWNSGYFKLYDCKRIVIKSEALHNEAMLLLSALRSKGLEMVIETSERPGDNSIELSLGKIDAPGQAAEAYQLGVSQNKVLLSANAPHGIFNGIQTLLQIIRDGIIIDNCQILDWPSFSWRGFMIDVGRNYQSVKQLKQQIGIMAKYKLNVFHFHPTEDIAWRIAIKQYPQLTAPGNMLRNKGMYYTEAEIKDLVAFCRERYIEFVPEIDMPGHSDAFKRAMKVDMQSDSGMVYLKDIVRELCETYDIQYLHIGADEVKIINKNFVPEMTAYIQRLGKKVIGWEPGGNFTTNTVRQLWMDDNAHVTSDSSIQFIDSRHLYLNHMDPLESVVTIFNRKLGNKNNGDANALGATICMWHDRAVAGEEDILRMNPVYPSMLTFAERSWRGGGRDGWVADIGKPRSKRTDNFAAFENRLLDQKQQYFSQLHFPYVKQAGINWKLYGPYNNGGELAKIFEIEKSGPGKLRPADTVIGGTIVWRHWWAPKIEGVLDEPKQNTTWYASTRIWSHEAGEQLFWIGFNNLSRSPATDSPPAGAWDNHQSKVWVNGKLVEPPHWTRAGQKGNAEIPLIDEGYEYREPTKILLKKGWNDVLIKSPIGSFKGKNWQNPEKWMFTFVPLSTE